MTTELYDAALLPLCTQAIDPGNPSAGSLGDRAQSPVRVCHERAGRGEFRLQLAMTRGRAGEVSLAVQTLQLLDALIGPLVGERLAVDILEYSYGQYARFVLEVDTRRNRYRVMKTMYGQTWALCDTACLTRAVSFVQDSVYLDAEDGMLISGR